ncbi:hypothetical protein SDC9_116258 [bioreactor metagenome]|uniref:Uncharacterized protein n=1 Tax=bioreactor metagenome TaxID=1076179 RepID=A0A645C1T3_9ZZZZ
MGLTILHHGGWNHLPRSQQRDPVGQGAAIGGPDNVFKAFGGDRILFVGQLQQFRFMNGDVVPGQLLGDVASFQPGDQMDAGSADHGSHLFDGDVAVAAQIRHIAAIMFIGKNQSDAQIMFLKGSKDPVSAFPVFRRRDPAAFVYCRSGFQNGEHQIEIRPQAFGVKFHIQKLMDNISGVDKGLNVGDGARTHGGTDQRFTMADADGLPAQQGSAFEHLDGAADHPGLGGVHGHGFELDCHDGGDIDDQFRLREERNDFKFVERNWPPHRGVFHGAGQRRVKPPLGHRLMDIHVIVIIGVAVGEDRVRPEFPDLGDDRPAGTVINFNAPILLLQIDIFGDAQNPADLGGFAGADGTDFRFFRRGGVAFVAGGKMHQPDLCSGVGEFTDGAAHADDFIVGMGAEDQNFHDSDSLDSNRFRFSAGSGCYDTSSSSRAVLPPVSGGFHGRRIRSG